MHKVLNGIDRLEALDQELKGRGWAWSRAAAQSTGN